MAEFIRENNIMISVSLDGPKKFNDFNRKFRGSGKGSYHAAVKGLDTFVANNCIVGLSITITESIVDNESLILDWIKNLPISSTYCNLLHSSNIPIEKMIILYKKSADFCSKIDKETGIREGRFSRRNYSFRNGDFIFSDCAAIGINQITVDPDGRLFYCHCSRQEIPIANVHDINTFEAVYEISDDNPWCNFAPIERVNCLYCPGISICGGGCYGINVRGTNRIMDTAFCSYIMRTLDIILLDLFKSHGYYR
ncbi:MAG: SPASM domain-containing protein [Anaerolineaceae bacterium]|nr:SPASM domain-containing protein [Anaerolineaceae bacterium]